jgi:hypothetical protein
LAIASCTGRATASVNRCTETASTWTITRRTTIGASSSAPALRIEPGVYFDDFGVRSEIIMIVGPRDARVTGPVQTAIVALA